jgi:tRNA dimethylallyltransferase
MTVHPLRNALILTGPTGSGKSRLALDLAERLGAEIVSMDSMALYRHMDVGTAKPGPADRRRVPHHLLDVLDPWESASVAWWLGRAAECCRDIEARGRRVLFVGGTPLYLKALLRGLFEGPPADEALRARLADEAERHGRAALHDRLARVDPAGAARLHVNDVRRVIRALEVWELTGRPISAWQTQWAPEAGRVEERGARSEERGLTGAEERAGVHPLSSMASSILGTGLPCLCLDLPRPVLYQRIDARVERMLAGGLVEEVRALRRLERPPGREASQALGYKEVFDYLDGRVPLDETVRRIQTRTRNFAKRQLTWFRHLPECRFVEPAALESFSVTAKV